MSLGLFPAPIASGRSRRIYTIVLWASLAIWLLPLLAIIATSLRGADDIARGNYWGLPTQWKFVENYLTVFTNTPLLQYAFNSAVIVVVVIVGCLTISSMAGFAFAAYRFAFDKLMFVLLVAGNFVPSQVLMVPVRELMIGLGLYDTIWALILFHMAFHAGFCTLFMRNFIRELPHELLEAARVDGASELRIFLTIVLPMVRPALAALAVLLFTFVWNDYFWALVLVQDVSAQPITTGLQAVSGQWVTAWHLVSAGSIIAAVPPVVVFFLMQRQLVQGLTLGAVKG